MSGDVCGCVHAAAHGACTGPLEGCCPVHGASDACCGSATLGELQHDLKREQHLLKQDGSWCRVRLRATEGLTEPSAAPHQAVLGQWEC